MALSGGVDSSVAAALLLKQGYKVTAAFMVNFTDHDAHGLPCYSADYRDALRVAARLGVKLLKFDFTAEYQKEVLDYVYREYAAGRTPNPDVLCNQYIKFGSWLSKARELGFAKLATGHYAKLKIPNQKSKITDHGNASYSLCIPKDEVKDQTYFLHRLNQQQLAHCLFPLADYTKDEVRRLARRFDLPTADKAESMGMCFVGEVPMKEFLQTKLSKEPGPIVLSNSLGGKKVGEHEGLAFYTLGQRHVGVAAAGITKGTDSSPLFVVGKRFETNELVLGFEDDPLLYTTRVEVENMHWISGQAPELPFAGEVRLRHRQALRPAELDQQDNKIVMSFPQPERAVTPGQFAVVYNKGECLGGGVVS